MRHALGVILLLVVGSAQAAIISIDFDDQSAPPTFSSQVPLAEEYASLGVHFFGSGEVLNSDSNFGVSLGMPFSSPNFLAFNNGSGAFPPEIISFDFLATSLSLDFAGSTGNISLMGFLDGVLIDTVSILSGSSNAWTTLTLAGSGYDEIVFDVSGVDCCFVVDNISINAVPIPAAVWLFGSGLGLLGWFRRRQS
jgi:hypothetical protein